MATRELSTREAEIVELCVDGLTNEAIAHRLGLSVGTVNTYWVRIKLKVGGSGRTDTVVKVIKERAERALRESNSELKTVAEMLVQREQSALELRAALALLQLAMNQIKSTVWATDRDLVIHILANGETTATHFGVPWEVGRTIYEVFKTTDPANPALAAHLGALKGQGSEVRLTGEYENMVMRVIPLFDEAGDVLGCISILNIVVA